MGDLSDLLAALSLERQLALYRVFGHQTELIAALLDSIAQDVQAKLAGERELTDARRDRLNRIVREVREIVDDGYVAYGERFADDLKDLAQQESRWVASSLNGAVGVDLVKTVAPTPVLMALVDTGLFQGSLLDDWLARQSGETGFQFTQQIRLGVAQGETNAQILRRLVGSRRLGQAGVIETSRRNAEALALTAIQTVTQRASMLTYEANDDLTTGWTQLSTLDGRTSDICIAYSGKEWDKEFKPVGHKLPYNSGCPRHFRCRSRILPKLKTFRELGLDVDEFTPSARASMDGPVAANMTFEQFLDRKGAAFQDEMLGRGRAQLWRDGKISLAQLLDQRGNPLTLAELRAKYE